MSMTENQIQPAPKCEEAGGKPRILYIDNMRGIAILLVLLGHSIAEFTNPVNQGILSFHMPLFFFISGLCAKPKEQSLWALLKSIAYTLLIPIFITGCITVATSILVDVVIQKELTLWQVDYTVLYKGWFLWSLLVVKLLYWAKAKLHRSWIFGLTAGVQTLVGILLYSFGVPAGLVTQAMIGAVFFDVGVLLQKPCRALDVKKRGGGGVLLSILLFCVLCFLSRQNTPVGMYRNDYGNIALFFATSALGIFVVFVVSKCLGEVGFLRWCSQNSIVLYMIHIAILRFLHKLADVIFGSGYVYPYYWLKFALLLIIAIPSTLFINKYVPFLFGKTKEKKSCHSFKEKPF